MSETSSRPATALDLQFAWIKTAMAGLARAFRPIRMDPVDHKIDSMAFALKAHYGASIPDLIKKGSVIPHGTV